MPDDRPASPAFQFYPKDFLSDEKQVRMSLAAAGIYVRLICHCWNEGSLPSDAGSLARLAGATKRQIADLWPSISPCFRTTEEGRLIHPRLEREREKQATYRQRQSDKGKASAHMRAMLDVSKSPNSVNLLVVPTAIQPPPLIGANGEIARETEREVQPRLVSGCPPVDIRLQPKSNSSSSSAICNLQEEKEISVDRDVQWATFKAAYPAKGREQGFMALQYFLQGCRDVGFDGMMRAVERYAKSKNVQSGFVLGMGKWLEKGLWIQEPEAADTSAANVQGMEAELAKIDAERAARGK